MREPAALATAPPRRQPTVLIVDDQPLRVDDLTRRLRLARYRVLITQDGPTAVFLAAEAAPDVVIVDMQLAGMMAVEVWRAVRRDQPTPILMLSSREDEVDALPALQFLGANDYLINPQRLPDLLATVEAILHNRDVLKSLSSVQDGRAQYGAPAAPRTGDLGRVEDGVPSRSQLGSAPILSALVSDDLIINLPARTVTRAGLLIRLKPREFELLVFLAQHPGQVFARQVLLEQVWGADVASGVRTVDVHVRELRVKVEPNPQEPRFIQTVFGIGYRFSRPVHLYAG